MSREAMELLGRIQQRAAKFVAKVKDGRAVSTETYADMQATIDDVIALRAALAAPDQQPVAWEYTSADAIDFGETRLSYVKPVRVKNARPLVYADAAPAAQEGKP